MTTAKAPRKDGIDDDVSGVLGAIRNSIGDGGAQILGSAASMKLLGVTSTQAPSLDLAIGRGGIPWGKITVLWAGEGTGKTTIGLHLIAECQRLGGLAIKFDMEHALDPAYARAIGVKLKRLIISQPDTLEEVLEAQIAALNILKKRREATGVRRPALFVVDSVNACIPKRILEGDPGDQFVGEASRKWSEQLPKIKKLADQEGVALLYISQIRHKIGVMFGSPDTMAGGNSLKFYSDLTLKMWREGGIKDPTTGKKIGHKLGIEAVKNKISSPFQKASMEIRYGVGIVKEASLLEALLESGKVVDRSGSLYLGEEKIGRGRRSGTEWVAARYDELLAQFRRDAGWEASPK